MAAARKTYRLRSHDLRLSRRSIADDAADGRGRSCRRVERSQGAGIVAGMRARLSAGQGRSQSDSGSGAEIETHGGNLFV